MLEGQKRSSEVCIQVSDSRTCEIERLNAAPLDPLEPALVPLLAPRIQQEGHTTRLVDLTIASWNPVMKWLQYVDVIRCELVSA